jgi:serine protease AprX
MRNIATLLLLFAATVAQAQYFPRKYFVPFTDKASTPFTIAQPDQFLSQRALQRRAAQNIAIDATDLPVDPAYVQQVAATGATVLHRSKWFNGVTVLVNDATQLAAIGALPFVGVPTPVTRLGSGTASPKLEPEPDGKTANGNGGGTTDYGMGLNQIDMLGGIPLHENGFRGNGMVIAVLDAGFINVDNLPIFDSLRNENRIIATRDFVEGDLNVYGHHGHGTSVLSTMAGNLPGLLVGTAPKAQYMLLRSEDGDTENPIEEENWVAAAEFADSAGADVINSSLGYTTFDSTAFSHTYADMDGVTTRVTQGANMAASKGIMVVASAGNEGSSAWQHIGSPADGVNVLAIGAVDPTGVYASFSSQGPSADGRIKPDVVAQGKDAVIVSASQGVGVQTGNGTSFSGPILCGMATCLWQMYPALTNFQIMDAIRQSASQYDAPDALLGYGIPDFTFAQLVLSGHVPSDIDSDELVTVFPVPFSDVLNGHIYTATRHQAEIHLTDLAGRKVAGTRTWCGRNCYQTFTLADLGTLPAGVYVLSVVTANGKFDRKVVKDQK